MPVSEAIMIETRSSGEAAADLLARVAAAHGAVAGCAGNGADFDPAGAASVSARARLVLAAALRIWGDEVQVLFRPYQLPPTAACTPSKTASRYELQAMRSCLERLACYLKMKISEPPRADVVVN
jgi:hypothetical protein